MAVSRDEVVAVLAEESGLDPAKIRPEATFEELDIGSIDVASTLFAIEDKFGVVVEPDQLDPASTVTQFVDLVLRLADA